MKVAIYARVSTDYGQNPETQLLPLRQLSAARGWQIHREYIDQAQSGMKASRPALDDLMRDARRRAFDAVVVWRFDRFARSLKHLVLALEEFDSLGIQFISQQEQIDTSTPMGKAMFAIIGAMAELERNLIVDRVKAGIARRRAEGLPVGGRPRVFNRQRLLEMREAGASQREIARALGISNGTVWNALKKGAAA